MQNILFYLYIVFLTYVDIYYSWLVIEESNNHIGVCDGAKSVLLGLSALKILVEVDDMLGRTYLKFLVKSTEDGFILLMAPNYTITDIVEV